MVTITEKSLKPVLILLSFAGFYSNEKKSQLQKIWSYITYIQLLYTVICTLRELIYGKNLDSIQTNLMVIILIVNGSSSFKLLSLFVKENGIKKCIDYFGQDKFSPRNEAELRILKDCVYICNRNVILYWSIVLFDVTSWSIYNFFGRNRSLPVSVWLPYDYKSGRLVFWFTYIIVTSGFCYVLIFSQGIEPLVAGLMYQGTCQIRILKHNLQNLHKSGNVFEMLKRCIIHHNDILDFFEKFEFSFSYYIFCQIAGITLGLCYCCYGLVTNTDESKLYSAICAGGYLGLSFQIFFYCYFGTLLSKEYEEVMVAIYLSCWYEYDTTNRKLLITVMERSKKPLILTAGKIVNLTLATFTSVIKTGYSLVAVLRSSY